MRTPLLWAAAITFTPLLAGAQPEDGSAEAEAGGSASASTEAPAAASVETPVVHGGRNGDFASPNGQLGAGLSFSPEQKGRIYGELTFSRQSYDLFGTDLSFTYFSWILGGGYKVTPDIELEVMLPMAFVSASFDGDGESDSETGLGVGNLHMGANWLHQQGALRMKIGGALQLGVWELDPEPRYALAGAFGARAAHDIGLWSSETLSVVTPSRVEYGDRVVLTGDGALGVHVPLDGGDTEVTVQLDPGVGFYATDTVIVGGRLPMVFILTNSGDMAQLALEPYARFDIGRGFINTRFTLNLDEPLGFAFDEGRFWGLHVGGGGTF